MPLPLSMLWVYENILSRFSNLVETLRYVLASKENMAAYAEHVQPLVRVTLSTLVALREPVYPMLRFSNVLLDCVAHAGQCWKVAARCGSVDLMRFLDKHGVAGCEPAVVASTIAHESVACLQYLYATRYAPDPADAEKASAHGSIEMLATVIQSCQGVSVSIPRTVALAFRAAARAGNTHVMQWLHDSFEKIPDAEVAQALRSAVDSDQVDAAIWIFENIPCAKPTWLPKQHQRQRLKQWMMSSSSPSSSSSHDSHMPTYVPSLQTFIMKIHRDSRESRDS